MSDTAPRTEAGLRQRRGDALARMRRSARIAYFHAAGALFLYVVTSRQDGDWALPLDYLVTAVALAALGYGVGRRRSALAASLLVALVLGLTVLQIATGGRTPSILVVAVFAWFHGQAFLAAREYKALEGLRFEPAAPAT